MTMYDRFTDRARKVMNLANQEAQRFNHEYIGMRMLSPRELARAQGFPDSYILTGTKMSQVHKIGNSVSPPVARAIVEANFAGVTA